MVPSSPWISLVAIKLTRKLTKGIRLMSSTSLPSSKGPYKLLFPGQGSQYVGMTSTLTEPLSSSLQELFDTSNEVLGYNVRDVMLNGPLNELSQTIFCQPAVVVASLAAYYSLDTKIKTECNAMAGFSVGEITALIAADGISLKQGLLLVKERAKAMHQACRATPSGMLTIIGLEEDKLQKYCKEIASKKHETISIANHLFPLGYIVAGTLSTLPLLKSIAIDGGAMSIKDVTVAGGFHSSLMSPAVQKVQKVLQTIDVSMPRVPLYSNVTGKPYTSVDEIKELLALQLIQPVLWNQTIQCMIEENGGELGFAEVGPGRQLRSMLGRINRKSFSNCINIQI